MSKLVGVSSHHEDTQEDMHVQHMQIQRNETERAPEMSRPPANDFEMPRRYMFLVKASSEEIRTPTTRRRSPQ
eukprot:5791721-Pyramimonas_sp.AAC.1